MPKITIDGQEIEVARGTTVLEAAKSLGREIPHYCYHPGLSISGNCRMCLVEVEKAPKLMIGCATEVTDGMVVNTENERVKEARQAVMEFLLVNHPLDCPICDQAGECRLQEYSVEHGRGYSRSNDTKVLQSKAIDIGEHIMLDQERCIQCSRCIRFCDEITKTGELAFFQRGQRTIIGIYPGKRLDNAYSGNVVDICPVGALTLKEFRFQTRVWYLKNTPSVCAGCARGCNVMIGIGQQQQMQTTSGQYDDRIKRLVPRFNEAVNGHWMCDEGRLSYRRLTAADRLGSAQHPAGTDQGWDEAVRSAAGRLKEAAASGKVGAIFSARLTSETMFAWRKLFEGLGPVRIGTQSNERGTNDDILIRADKGANSMGARWILGDKADARNVRDAATSGEIDVLVVLGDSLDPDDTPAIDERVAAKVQSLVYVGPFLDATARQASILLPSASWSEEDGSYVNFEGHVQWLRRCHLPRGEGRPGWRVVCDLAEAAGVELPSWTSADDVLRSMSESVEPFRGLTREEIGLSGRRVE